MADPTQPSPRGIPASLTRSLPRAERIPATLKHPSLPTDGRIFEAPQGYKSAGIVIVENFQLVKDTVPQAVHDKADSGGDVIVKLRSETIVKDGRMVGDKIEAEYFVRDEFLCV
jgi:hypothetical protein